MDELDEKDTLWTRLRQSWLMKVCIVMGVLGGYSVVLGGEFADTGWWAVSIAAVMFPMAVREVRSGESWTD